LYVSWAEPLFLVLGKAIAYQHDLRARSDISATPCDNHKPRAVTVSVFPDADNLNLHYRDIENVIVAFVSEMLKLTQLPVIVVPEKLAVPEQLPNGPKGSSRTMISPFGFPVT